MTRRGQDGGFRAAPGGAARILNGVLKPLPGANAETTIERPMRALDLCHFEQHPDTLSSVWLFARGQVAALLRVPSLGQELVAVLTVYTRRLGRVHTDLQGRA